jgi:hypothetical protein
MPYNSSLPKTELQLPTALESMPLKCIRCWILCSPPRRGTEPIRLRIDDFHELRDDPARLTSWGATPGETRGQTVHLLGSGPFQVENTVSDSVPNQRNFVYRWSPRAGRVCWREKVPSSLRQTTPYRPASVAVSSGVGDTIRGPYLPSISTVERGSKGQGPVAPPMA